MKKHQNCHPSSRVTGPCFALWFCFPLFLQQRWWEQLQSTGNALGVVSRQVVSWRQAPHGQLGTSPHGSHLGPPYHPLKAMGSLCPSSGQRILKGLCSSIMWSLRADSWQYPLGIPPEAAHSGGAGTWVGATSHLPPVSCRACFLLLSSTLSWNSQDFCF